LQAEAEQLRSKLLEGTDKIKDLTNQLAESRAMYDKVNIMNVRFCEEIEEQKASHARLTQQLALKSKEREHLVEQYHQEG